MGPDSCRNEMARCPHWAQDFIKGLFLMIQAAFRKPTGKGAACRDWLVTRGAASIPGLGAWQTSCVCGAAPDRNRELLEKDTASHGDPFCIRKFQLSSGCMQPTDPRGWCSSALITTAWSRGTLLAAAETISARRSFICTFTRSFTIEKHLSEWLPRTRHSSRTPHVASCNRA